MRRHLLWGLIAAFLFGSSLPALAVDNAATKSLSDSDKKLGIIKRRAFADWEMLCDKVKCTLVQVVREKKSKELFMTAEIAADAEGKRGIVFNIAPVGIDFLKGLQLATADGSNVQLSLRTCYPAGCIATLPIENVGGLEAFAKSGKIVHVVFSTLDNGDFRIPVTLNGLPEAVADLPASANP